MKILIFILFSLLQINLFSQTNSLKLNNPNIQTGIDYENRNYLVFNGFDLYYSKLFSSKEWQNVEYKYNELPKSDDFPYEFFQIKNKNYLVYSGCGEVYEFRNDSIIRIDNSFQHKNQFKANKFVYNDELYFFGGYGLFTFKNILTKFDFKTREWELVKYKNNDNLPEPRDRAISFLKDDTLYIISGFVENPEFNKTDAKQIFDIWKLNLKSKVWTKIGDLSNQNELKGVATIGSKSYRSKNKFYSDFNQLIGFDFEKNNIDFYKPEERFKFSSYEKYNLQNDEIIYAITTSNDSKRETTVLVEPFKNYNGNINATQELTKTIPFVLIIIIASIIILALFSFLYLKKKSKGRAQNVIHLNDGHFYHNDKVINNFATDEYELLIFLYKNRNSFLQMNEIVDFVSKNDKSNYNTLTKKKDSILNRLKQKLSFILSVDEELVFDYKKNVDDKRIREIQLNQEYFWL